MTATILRPILSRTIPRCLVYNFRLKPGSPILWSYSQSKRPPIASRKQTNLKNWGNPHPILKQDPIPVRNTRSTLRDYLIWNLACRAQRVPLAEQQKESRWFNSPCLLLHRILLLEYDHDPGYPRSILSILQRRLISRATMSTPQVQPRSLIREG